MDDGEIHAGYEFESGMFARMRSWVDVAPWIRLARVTRILASPLHVGLVFIALAITAALLSSHVSRDALLSPLVQFVWTSSLPDHVAEQFLTADATAASNSWYAKAIMAVVLILLWTPVMQWMARSGASLVAGKGLPSVSVTSRLVRDRFLKSMLVWVVPAVCVSGMLLGIFLLRLPSIWFPAAWLSTVTGWIVGLACLPVGVLGFGALFAIPLGLAAMVAEADPDPIDSLSRGYEYLFRRPLSLAWYAVVLSINVYVFSWLLGGLGISMSVAARWIGSSWFADAIMIQSAGDVVGLLVLAWLATLVLASLGGVYLLLRYDAGGQEVEDMWEPPKPESPTLPSLPREAIGEIE